MPDITDFSKMLSDTALKMNHSSIEQIPISKLKDNPQNFYGLRDIDSLADSIALSHFVEPLVVEKIDGKDEYLLISGHRRKAAWQKLLDNGTVTDDKLPCMVCDFAPISSLSLSREDCATMYLMLSNMGQRKIRTVDEKLQEVDRLEPIAKKIFKSLPNKNSAEIGYFRGFFATKFMNLSSTSLQRLQALRKLISEAKAEVDAGTMSLTFASELASLPPDEQKSYLEAIKNGEHSTTVHELIEYKQHRNQPEAEADESTEEPEASEEQPDEPQEELQESPEEHPDEEPAEDESEIGSGEPDGEPDDEIPEAGMEHPEGYAEPIAPLEDEPEDEPPKPSEPKVVCDIKGIPKKIADPQAEAKDWLNEQQLSYLSQLKEYADNQVQFYEDTDELLSSQWKVRASVLSVQILMLKGF